MKKRWTLVVSLMLAAAMALTMVGCSAPEAEKEAATTSAQGQGGEGMATEPVSYTHLDVYKRQLLQSALTQDEAGMKETLGKVQKDLEELIAANDK